MTILLRDLRTFDELAYKIAVAGDTLNGSARIINKFGQNLDIDATSSSGSIELQLPFPFIFPEFTKIKATCTAETTNTRAYVDYDIALIENGAQ